MRVVLAEGRWGYGECKHDGEAYALAGLGWRGSERDGPCVERVIDVVEIPTLALPLMALKES